MATLTLWFSGLWNRFADWMLKNLELRASEALEHCKQNLMGHSDRILEDLESCRQWRSISWGSRGKLTLQANGKWTIRLLNPIKFWQRIWLCSENLSEAKLKNNRLYIGLRHHGLFSVYFGLSTGSVLGQLTFEQSCWWDDIGVDSHN